MKILNLLMVGLIVGSFNEPFIYAATCYSNPYRDSIMVDDGAGKLVFKTFYVYRPKGLINSPSNKVPALVHFEPYGPAILSVADSNKFIVIEVPRTISTGYLTRTITVDQSLPVLNTCGPNGNGPCDDAPFINKLLDTLIMRENIDPNLIFATGGSKGGMMTEDCMCDTTLNPRFRGFVPVSAVMQSLGGASTIMPRCPALAKNHNFCVQWQYDPTDNTYLGNLSTGFVDAKGRWTFSQLQNLTLVVNPELGCMDGPVVETLGNTGKISITTYTNCKSPGRAISVLAATGAGHGLGGIQWYDGIDVMTYTWHFLMKYSGQIATNIKQIPIIKTGTDVGFRFLNGNLLTPGSTLNIEYQGLSASATFSLYDVQGKLIFSLPLHISSGKSEFSWDGKGLNGSTLNNGLYLVKLQAGRVCSTQKILVIQ